MTPGGGTNAANDASGKMTIAIGASVGSFGLLLIAGSSLYFYMRRRAQALTSLKGIQNAPFRMQASQNMTHMLTGTIFSTLQQDGVDYTSFGQTTAMTAMSAPTFTFSTSSSDAKTFNSDSTAPTMQNT